MTQTSNRFVQILSDGWPERSNSTHEVSPIPPPRPPPPPTDTALGTATATTSAWYHHGDSSFPGGGNLLASTIDDRSANRTLPSLSSSTSSNRKPSVRAATPSPITMTVGTSVVGSIASHPSLALPFTSQSQSPAPAQHPPPSFPSTHHQHIPLSSWTDSRTEEDDVDVEVDVEAAAILASVSSSRAPSPVGNVTAPVGVAPVAVGVGTVKEDPHHKTNQQPKLKARPTGESNPKRTAMMDAEAKWQLVRTEVTDHVMATYGTTDVVGGTVTTGGSTVATTKEDELDDDVLRGITMRPSGAWQAQIYFAGKTRYIGVFDSTMKAAMAYQMVRDRLKKPKPLNRTLPSRKIIRKATTTKVKAAGKKRTAPDNVVIRNEVALGPTNTNGPTTTNAVVATAADNSKRLAALPLKKRRLSSSSSSSSYTSMSSLASFKTNTSISFGIDVDNPVMISNNDYSGRTNAVSRNTGGGTGTTTSIPRSTSLTTAQPPHAVPTLGTAMTYNHPFLLPTQNHPSCLQFHEAPPSTWQQQHQFQHQLLPDHQQGFGKGLSTNATTNVPHDQGTTSTNYGTTTTLSSMSNTPCPSPDMFRFSTSSNNYVSFHDNVPLHPEENMFLPETNLPSSEQQQHYLQPTILPPPPPPSSGTQHNSSSSSSTTTTAAAAAAATTSLHPTSSSVEERMMVWNRPQQPTTRSGGGVVVTHHHHHHHHHLEPLPYSAAIASAFQKMTTNHSSHNNTYIQPSTKATAGKDSSMEQDEEKKNKQKMNKKKKNTKETSPVWNRTTTTTQGPHGKTTTKNMTGTTTTTAMSVGPKQRGSVVVPQKTLATEVADNQWLQIRADVIANVGIAAAANNKKKIPVEGGGTTTITMAESSSLSSLPTDMMLDKDVLRGITMRPSGKWQAQIYFLGKSRYIGVFQTREEAALAYELVRGSVKPPTTAASTPP